MSSFSSLAGTFEEATTAVVTALRMGIGAATLTRCCFASGEEDEDEEEEEEGDDEEGFRVFSLVVLALGLKLASLSSMYFSFNCFAGFAAVGSSGRVWLLPLLLPLCTLRPLLSEWPLNLFARPPLASSLSLLSGAVALTREGRPDEMRGEEEPWTLT
jgi:hypothetical protein